jgi:plastocyanin
MMMRAASILGCLLIAGIVGTADAANQVVTHVIVIEGVKFTPDALTLKRGEWVQWINKDPFPHTATAKGVFDSHSIASGGTWKYRVRVTGDIDYVCTFHPNMVARLHIER